MINRILHLWSFHKTLMKLVNGLLYVTYEMTTNVKSLKYIRKDVDTYERNNTGFASFSNSLAEN